MLNTQSVSRLSAPPSMTAMYSVKRKITDFHTRTSAYIKIEQKYYNDFQCHNTLVNGSLLIHKEDRIYISSMKQFEDAIKRLKC